MKGFIATALVFATLVAGVLWYSSHRNARIAVEQEQARQAAAQALQDQRKALFGDEALADDVHWTDAGLGIKHLVEGNGSRPIPGSFVLFNYVVRLADGTEVQRTEKPTEARIGQMIPGVSSGLQQMREGGRALLFIPPVLGYGRSAYGSIPPNSGLLFEVELLRP